MQRFKKYIGMDVNIEKLRDTERIKDFGIFCKYIPDSIEEFDECEFFIDPRMQDIILCVAILEGKIKRIMFVRTDQSDPEAAGPLSESQLKEILDKHGEQIVSFFTYITQ